MSFKEDYLLVNKPLLKKNIYVFIQRICKLKPQFYFSRILLACCCLICILQCLSEKWFLYLWSVLLMTISVLLLIFNYNLVYLSRYILNLLLSFIFFNLSSWCRNKASCWDSKAELEVGASGNILLNARLESLSSEKNNIIISSEIYWQI